MMAKVDGFLEELRTYDKENIHAECLKAIKPYLADPQFNADFIRSKSLAAAGNSGATGMLETSRLHELHESKCPFVSRIEFIRSKLSNFSAHVSGSVCRPLTPASVRRAAGRSLRLGD